MPNRRTTDFLDSRTDGPIISVVNSLRLTSKKMKQFKALGVRGFSHELVLVAVVLVVAVGGTYWLVASHADTCSGASTPTTSAITSSPVTSPGCTPVTSASSPTSVAVVSKGSCVISGVPAAITKNSVFTISVSVWNLGTTTWRPAVTGTFSVNNGYKASLRAATQPFLPAPIAGHLSSTRIVLGSSKGMNTAGATRGTITASSLSPKFSCAKSFAVKS